MAAAPVNGGTSNAGRETLGDRLAAAAAMGASDFAWEDEAIEVGVSGATDSGNAPVEVGVSARADVAMERGEVSNEEWRLKDLATRSRRPKWLVER